MDKPLPSLNVQNSPMTVAYEEATLAEAPLVLSVILRAFAEFWGNLEPRSGAFAESAETIATKLKKGGAIKALVGQEIVGVVIYEPRPACMYFGRLSVLPSWRGVGIAKGLIRAVEARTLALGLARVEIGVRLVLAAHQEYYTALGYQPIAYECHPGFTEPTSVTMEKQLLFAL
jgi:predicted N-acetyltransferase YhbS